MIKLELGCGKNKRKGYIGIDIKDYSNLYPKERFIQWDLGYGLPDDMCYTEVKKIYAKDCLEHIFGLDKLMNELSHYCEGAEFEFIIPHTNISSMDFNHVRHSCYSLFLYNDDRFEVKSKYLRLNMKNIFPWRYAVELFLNLHPRIIWLFEVTILKNLIPSATIICKGVIK